MTYAVTVERKGWWSRQWWVVIYADGREGARNGPYHSKADAEVSAQLNRDLYDKAAKWQRWY